MLLTVFAFFFPPNTFTISIFVCLVLSFIVEVIPLFSPNYTIYILYSISHLIHAHAYSLITANDFFAYVYLHSCVVFINIITTFRAPMASTTTLSVYASVQCAMFTLCRNILQNTLRTQSNDDIFKRSLTALNMYVYF